MAKQKPVKNQVKKKQRLVNHNFSMNRKESLTGELMIGLCQEGFSIIDWEQPKLHIDRQ